MGLYLSSFYLQSSSLTYTRYFDIPPSPVASLSSSTLATPPRPLPPLHSPMPPSTHLRVICLDTNAASMLLNGSVLEHATLKERLLTVNPTWVELMRLGNIDVHSFEETRESLAMYRWTIENMGDVAMRITVTVESELMNATAVSSFTNYIHVSLRIL